MTKPGWIDPFEPEQVRRLVATFGSPLLIIDCERVRQQFRRLQKALPGVDLHYALKPLPHPAVVRTVAAMGGYLDLATTGEVQLITRLGLDPDALHPHASHQARQGHPQCAACRRADLRGRQSR